MHHPAELYNLLFASDRGTIAQFSYTFAGAIIVTTGKR
jgi:hypothetical protein